MVSHRYEVFDSQKKKKKALIKTGNFNTGAIEL